MRYFMELSYKGTAYNGWQRQDNAPSVQQTLEEAMSRFMREPIAVTGAGRTDTGVHAAYYVLHFDCANAIENCDDFAYRINAILPSDIAVHSVTNVADDAHARFDAVCREYKYYVSTAKNPFICETAWSFTGQLDVEAMNEAAEVLLCTEDFTTFGKLHSGNKTNICKVTCAEWSKRGDMLVFTIRADRFLRNMVRSITGSLVDVGRGKTSPDEFGNIVRSRDLQQATNSAPAQGLFLSDVKYPREIFEKRLKTTN